MIEEMRFAVADERALPFGVLTQAERIHVSAFLEPLDLHSVDMRTYPPRDSNDRVMALVTEPGRPTRLCVFPTSADIDEMLGNAYPKVVWCHGKPDEIDIYWHRLHHTLGSE